MTGPYVVGVDLSSRAIEDENGCWIWQGYIANVGYGRLYLEGQYAYAHRLSYEQAHGQIPDELEIDHTCSNKRCINPAHLEAVTHAENVRRWAERTRRDTCPAGHAYDEANTYISREGYRRCKRCRRENQNRRGRPCRRS